MLLRSWRTAAIGSLLIILNGCVSVPLAPEEIQTAVRQVTPPANRSHIYVIRHRQFGGSGAYVAVGLDGKVAGVLVNGTFVFLEVLPGSHEITVYLIHGSRRPIVQVGDKTGSLKGEDLARFQQYSAGAELDCLAGKGYFFSTVLTMGREAMQLRTLPEEDGRRLVNEYRMVDASHRPTGGL